MYSGTEGKYVSKQNVYQQLLVFHKEMYNPTQTGLFRHSLDWAGVSNAPPLHFLKNIYSIDVEFTRLIKRREINLLLLS